MNINRKYSRHSSLTIRLVCWKCVCVSMWKCVCVCVELCRWLMAKVSRREVLSSFVSQSIGFFLQGSWWTPNTLQPRYTFNTLQTRSWLAAWWAAGGYWLSTAGYNASGYYFPSKPSPHQQQHPAMPVLPASSVYGHDNSVLLQSCQAVSFLFPARLSTVY